MSPIGDTLAQSKWHAKANSLIFVDVRDICRQGLDERQTGAVFSADMRAGAQMSSVDAVLFDLTVEQLPMDAELARRGGTVARCLTQRLTNHGLLQACHGVG